MKNEKIIPIHNGMERLRIYTIDDVFDWIKETPQRIYWETDGYKINCKRAKIFYKKGLVCVNCGATGYFFALEKDKGGGQHLDLYGYINNEEVLITVDHIIPKSKGGPNKLINYQTMCKICNEMKADEESENNTY
jgi:5-methylcytosine-specific restriction endonuclease McrA